jgi:hypothetical protein
LKEAEKQLETLRAEVEELKRKDKERCGVDVKLASTSC